MGSCCEISFAHCCAAPGVAPGRTQPNRFTPSLFALEAREVPAIVASFAPATGVLTVTGDANSNTIVVSRDAGGNLFVNAGAVVIQGGPATVANTTRITMSGLAGHDTLRLDQTNGALPAAVMHGGDGNDTLEGGSGADQFFAQAGNDSVLGRGGDDTALLGAGNDVFTWNPGDGNDIIEGISASTACSSMEATTTRTSLSRTTTAGFVHSRRRQCHDGHERRRTSQLRGTWRSRQRRR